MRGAGAGSFSHLKKGGLAVLLAFQPVADGKNSRRPKLETGHSANDCQRGRGLMLPHATAAAAFLFFQKNPSPPSGSQVPSPCSQPGIDYVSLAKGAMSSQPAGRAAQARPWAGGRAGRRTGQLSTHLTKVQPVSRTDCGVANRNRGAPGLAEKRELHSRGAGACTSFTLLPARSIHSRARRA
jgi:hypothetical protein